MSIEPVRDDLWPITARLTKAAKRLSQSANVPGMLKVRAILIGLQTENGETQS